MSERIYMKKGQYFESVIERVDFPNKAVTYAEDRKVIIKNKLTFLYIFRHLI